MHWVFEAVVPAFGENQGSLESFQVRIHAPWAQALQALPPESMGGGIAWGGKTRGVCSPAGAVLVTIVRKEGYTSHIETKGARPQEAGWKTCRRDGVPLAPRRAEAQTRTPRAKRQRAYAAFCLPAASRSIGFAATAQRKSGEQKKSGGGIFFNNAHRSDFAQQQQWRFSSSACLP